MLKKQFASHLLPVIFIVGSTTGLVACTGNDSSATLGPSAVIDPIVVDKTIEAVEWNENNEVQMASHAYRAIAKNSMFKTVFANQQASFDLLVNLFRVSDTRNCRVSGRMITEDVNTECFLDDGITKINCSEDTADISIGSQLSQAVACQDGDLSGKYFNGFFNAIKKTDLTINTEERTSTTISAVGSTPELYENGEPVLDELGEPKVNKHIDYLFQTDSVVFFFDNKYESYIDFSTTDLSCGADTYKQVERQGIRSNEVGAFEGNGINNYYLYTKYTDLNLETVPTETCNGEGGLDITYSHSFSATIANIAMGGGIDSNTHANWLDMDLSLTGKPSGILTLIHENSDGNYTITLDFNTDGDVTINTANVNTPIILTLSEFLESSKSVTAE